MRTIALFHQVYDVNDTEAVKKCAESLTVADLWSLSYAARPEEWTPKEKKQKKRNPTKYKFLTAPQMKFMQEKDLRNQQNGRRAAVMSAHMKTKIWLASEVTLPDVASFQQQQKDFNEDNSTYQRFCYFFVHVYSLLFLQYFSVSTCNIAIVTDQSI